MSTLLEFSAKAEIQGAASSAPRVSGVAYGGGIMNLSGYGPVAIELAGMELPESIPLLVDHENRIDATVGAVTAAVVNGRLLVEGTLSLANEAGQTVRQLARDGVPLQLSVGAEPVGGFQEIPPGGVFTANGQTLTAGPRGVKLFPTTRLREVTVTPNGADASTSVSIQGRKDSMSTATPAVDSVKSYQERIGRIEEKLNANAAVLGQETVSELRAAAISGAIDEAGVNDRLIAELRQRADLAAYRAAAPKAPSTGFYAPGLKSIDGPTLLAAAWHYRSDEREAEKCYPAHVLESARDLARSGSLVEMMRAVAVREGFTPPANASEMLSASHGGFSTVSLPTTLGNVANKSAAVQFAEDLRPLLEMFPPVSVSNLKDHTQIRLLDRGEMTEVGQDGEVKSNTVQEAVYTIAADTYAAKTTLTRKAIINDDAGVFDTLTRSHTVKALRLTRKLMMKRWLDGAQFFKSANNNIVTSSTLSQTSLEAALIKMRKQTDEQGRSIDLVPRFLFVPPELEHLALRLITSDNYQYINNNESVAVSHPTGNSFGGLVVRTDARLSDTSFTGNSATSWYLIAGDSSLAPMKVAFLNGQRSPVVEVFGYDADPTVLGWTVRVYFEVGAGFYEPRSAVKATA